MIIVKVLSSHPDTCFVIASDLTAGQSKVGDLFRQSQNVLSFFFGRVKNVNQVLWWTPRCKPGPDYQCFQAFQVLAPIINVFKLDSGQLKWVFVLQA